MAWSALRSIFLSFLSMSYRRLKHVFLCSLNSFRVSYFSRDISKDLNWFLVNTQLSLNHSRISHSSVVMAEITKNGGSAVVHDVEKLTVESNFSPLLPSNESKDSENSNEKNGGSSNPLETSKGSAGEVKLESTDRMESSNQEDVGSEISTMVSSLI